ncbi:MAG TPA: PIN domain-containing protein [Pyrinomonadaceae bacterium]
MSNVEPKLCFIDTNVWLYAFIQSQDQSKTATAKTTIESSEIVLSSQVINEVCVNLIKKARFDEVSIRSLIESFYSKYHITGIDRTILLEASELRDRYSFSYWDSLIVSCALTAGAEIVYSEDLHAGLVVENRLQIVNPFTT